MISTIKPESRRLLEAIEYIDEEIVLGVLAGLKDPAENYASGEYPKPSPFKYWRQLATLAACILLLSIASPLVGYIAQVITDWRAAAGIGTTEYTTDVNAIEDTDTLTEKDEYTIPDKHIENAPYFIFSDDLEPISAEKINEARNAWYQIIYDHYYNIYYNSYASKPLYANDKELLIKHSVMAANEQAEKYRDMLFGNTIEDHFRCRYYATINGYIIFAFNTYLENEYNLMTVGSVSISNPTSFYILAYGDGEIVLLDEAYKSKWLSDSDISVIAERHKAFNEAWSDEKETYDYLQFVQDLEPISDAKMAEVRDAVYEKYYTESYERNLGALREEAYQYSDREAKEDSALGAHNSGVHYSEQFFNAYEEILQYHYRYYGIINDCVILVTYGSGEEFPVILEIAGYTFTFPVNYKFEVFTDNGFITVVEAYESGLLKKSDIQKLYERHLIFDECHREYERQLNEGAETTSLDYLKFIPELEEISEEEMLEIKNAWSQFRYETVYDSNYPLYVSRGYSDAEAHKLASDDAIRNSESAYEQFFNGLYFYYFGYLGILDESIVLASYSGTGNVKDVVIGGVDFGFKARFFIYTDGKIITLQEAYDEKIISGDELLIIKNRNEQYIESAYDYYVNQFQ